MGNAGRQEVEEVTEGFELESGNVFADMGFDNPEEG